MAKGWRDRIFATLLAMTGVALTVLVYYHFVQPLHVSRGHRILFLGMVLVFFTGVFSFIVFGFLERQQRQLTRANQQLERQRDILQGLWDATGIVGTLPDVEEVLQRIVEVARPLFDAEYAALAVLSDEDATKIRQFITSGMSTVMREHIGHLPTGRGMLGEVIRTKEVLRLNNLGDHPASVGFPPHHPAMSSFLGLPLLYQGEIVGHLYLTNKEGGFTAEDEVLAQLFARQAAVVISNAHLYQDRESWATVQERERIGRELHDGVLQTLYGLTLSLEFLLDGDGGLDDEVQKELNRITETLSLTMTDIRMYIQSLGTSPVDFYVALKDMLQRTGHGEVVQLEFHDQQYLFLDPAVIHDLVLSVQEAVSNAIRHGESSHVIVGWESADWEHHLWIEDNGQGFYDAMGSDAQNHFGLKNMERRMERLDGVMDVATKKGMGTTVRFRWPRSADIPKSF